MKMRSSQICLLLLAVLSFKANGQLNAPAPAPAATDLLGETFRSDSGGIELRIPVGCRRIASSNAGDDIAQFGDQQRKWQLKLTRIVRSQPTQLASSTDNFGKPVPGLLDTTVANLKRDLSGCTILRQDLTNIADAGLRGAAPKDNVGMIAVRYTVGAATYLSQQAIIQAGERLFYLIALTSPGAAQQGANAPPDPQEREAVDAFGQMLDSVRLLDSAGIRHEQEERLLRTRGRLMQMKSTSLLRSVLVSEQWLRILRNGRDVGYSYITEQTAAEIPRPLKPKEMGEGKGERDLVKPGDGVLIGIRSRVVNPPEVPEENGKAGGPVQVDTATWLFVKPDQSLEDWSRLMVATELGTSKDGNPVQRQSTEFGASTVSILGHHKLNVTTIGETGATSTVDQEVPKFYLPQALGHLLPRLLPRQSESDGSPRTYMFATYVPETQQVMSRYVDVGSTGDFKLNGVEIHAVPISDRLGWHGSVTIHYMSPDGRYLGSENKDTHTLIVPTNAQTLLSIWKGANLTRPEAAQRPAAPASGATSPSKP